MAHFWRYSTLHCKLGTNRRPGLRRDRGQNAGGWELAPNIAPQRLELFTPKLAMNFCRKGSISGVPRNLKFSPPLKFLEISPPTIPVSKQNHYIPFRGGVWGRGCDEAEISEERFFTGWGQGIQWMRALVRKSIGKAIQWRGFGHSVNRRTLWIEIFCAHPLPKSLLRPFGGRGGILFGHSYRKLCSKQFWEK